MHTHVSAVKIWDEIKSNVDVGSPPMLDIFIEDLPVQRISLSPFLSVIPRTSDRGGGITRQRPGTSRSGSGLGTSGDQIGRSLRGVLPEVETATDTPRCSFHQRCGLFPSHPFEGECWNRTTGYSVPSPAIIRGSLPKIY